MKYLVVILLLFPISSFAQQGMGSNAYAANNKFSSASAQGSIDMPTLMSIDCTTPPSNGVVLNNFEGYNEGIIVPYFVNVHVKCNKPWVVNMMSESRYLNKLSASASSNMPVNIYSLRNISGGDYIPLAPTPQTIIRNENNDIENTYSLDLKLKPEYGHQGGQYGVNIIFTLSPQ